jgi:hypothetical protein
MNIITAGCSFTKYKWSCWPNFIKWFEPEHNIINLGNSASSNETISRSVYNAVSKYKEIKKIYIMWSGANRYEVVVNNEVDKSKEGATWSRYDPDWNWIQYFGGHIDADKHEYYQKYFLNEKQDEIRLLEKILFIQLFLERKNIDYSMMCYMGNILSHDQSKMSKGHRALYNQIDWNNFIFYNQFKGLNEYATENYPNEFFKPNDLHPLPLSHYKWVKDIMYKSNVEPPHDELQKLINFKRKHVE